MTPYDIFRQYEWHFMKHSTNHDYTLWYIFHQQWWYFMIHSTNLDDTLWYIPPTLMILYDTFHQPWWYFRLLFHQWRRPCLCPTPLAYPQRLGWGRWHLSHRTAPKQGQLSSPPEDEPNTTILHVSISSSIFHIMINGYLNYIPYNDKWIS